MQNNKACTIDWLLIPAPDMEAAKVFYREVFNFHITDYSKTFSVFKAGNISGGLDSSLLPSRNSLSFSITVDNISLMLDKITQHKGSILKEKYSLGQNFGYCARFSDPNGNEIELYSDK